MSDFGFAEAERKAKERLQKDVERLTEDLRVVRSMYDVTAKEYEGSHARIVKLQARVAELEGDKRQSCEWFEDDDGWHSGCGREWEFFDDGPKENSVAFCMYCSKPVTIAEFIDVPESL